MSTSKLTASQFRIVTNDQLVTLIFRNLAGNVVEISMPVTALVDFYQAAGRAARETHLPLSERQSTGFRSVRKTDLRPEQESVAGGTAALGYGVAVTADLSMVVPFFSVPNTEGGGASQWTIALPPDAAEKLVADLQRALAVVKKPAPDTKPN